MDIGLEVKAAFLFQLVGGVKKNRILAGGGDLQERVFVAQTLDKMPPIYEFHPIGITGYHSIDLHNACVVNVNSGFFMDNIGINGWRFHKQRNYMEVSEDTTKSYPEIPQLVPQSTIDFVQQLPSEEFRFLASYLMALQLAKYEDGKKGKGAVRTAQGRLGWPDWWIKSAQQIEKRVT